MRCHPSYMAAADYRLFFNRALPPQERGCTSKAAYVSRREALNRARHGRSGYVGLRPYRCRWCSEWHLGHPPRHH